MLTQCCKMMRVDLAKVTMLTNLLVIADVADMLL